MSLIELIKLLIKLFNWTQNEKQNRAENSHNWLFQSTYIFGVLDFGVYQYNHKDYKPITDKWKELLPSDRRESKKNDSTEEDRQSEEATAHLRVATTDIWTYLRGHIEYNNHWHDQHSHRRESLPSQRN